MRITFLLTQDLESPSGLGRYGPWAIGLAKRGHDVRVLALHSNFSEVEEIRRKVDGVEVRYVSQMHVRKLNGIKTYYSTVDLIRVILLATIRLTWSILFLPSDLVIVGKPHPMNGIASLVGKLKQRYLILLDIDDDEAGSGNFKSEWQQRVVEWFELWLPKKVDLISTNTTYMQRKLIQSSVPKGKITYLPNGVDIERFPKFTEAELHSLAGELGVQGKRIVLFVGSLSRANHPLDLLIEAFTKVIQVYSDAVLLVVGGGEDGKHFQQIVNKFELDQSVYFLGRISSSEVYKYYQLAEVSIDPVHDDLAALGRCPLKLFESWACGTPFITGNVGDRPLLVGDPPAALLVQPGDPVDLANGIINILSDPALATLLKQLGTQRVKNYFWNELITQFDQAIKLKH